MKAMISQPMRGETMEQIKAVREKAKKKLEKQGYEVVDNWIEGFEEWNMKGENVPLKCLAKSLEKMSEC